MRLGRQRAADMTEGPIWRHLIQFALPMLVGLLFQQLYNTVDTIIVGQFVGREALAAVGSTSPIINTLVGFAVGLASGCTVVISQCYGAHDYRTLGRAVHTTVSLTLIVSLVLSVLGVLIVTPLLNMMSTPEDVFGEAYIYLIIYFSGMLGLLVYNMGSGILRAVGDSTRPLYFLVFSAVVNTVLDLLFVVVFDMGVAGVAWATVIAQGVSVLLCIIHIRGKNRYFHFEKGEFVFSKQLFRYVMRMGIPSAVQNGVTNMGFIFVQGLVNSFSTMNIAAYTAAMKLESLAMVPFGGISQAFAVFAGHKTLYGPTGIGGRRGQADQRRAAQELDIRAYSGAELLRGYFYRRSLAY